MSQFSYKELPSFSNVSAGSTAVLQVPLGYSYNAINIEYSGVTLAQLQDIEVRINGKVLQSFSDATRLQDINKYYKRNIKAGVITLWFETPEFKEATRRSTAIGTMDVSTFDVAVNIDAAAAAPVLKASAIRSNNLPLGAIIKYKRFSASAAAAGIKEIDNLPRESRIKAIHLFKSDISKAEVELDSTIWYDPSKTLGAGIQTDYGRNPNTAKMTTVDFTLHGDPMQALVVQNAFDFRVRTHCASAGAFDIVVEYLSGYTGI
ncbi:hypothetical protein NBRC116592_12950 [Colwellia sp. KU-HH00111]|uniref:major capsid protein P2 n=1 Tax=Colwellia sp. KU-HH00111 TaxID=3127652 RepID=UPI00310327A7